MSTSRPRRSTVQRQQVTVDVIGNEESDEYPEVEATDSSDEAFEEEEQPVTPARRGGRSKTTRPSQTPKAKEPVKKTPVKVTRTPKSPKAKMLKSTNGSALTAAMPVTIKKDADPNTIDPYPSQLTNRSYHGPLRLRRRIGFVLERFYGPRPVDIKIAASLINFWYRYDEAPVSVLSYLSAWMPRDFAVKQTARLEEWRAREVVGRQREVLDVTAVPREPEKDTMVVMDGREIRVQAGQAQWVPAGEAARPGWMINMAGTVLDMSWLGKVVCGKQTLAVCVVPFAETDGRPGTEGVSNGVVQFLTFTELSDEKGRRTPVVRELRVPWGFSRRLKWCPENTEKGLGILAVLSTEGQVHVLEVYETEGYSTHITRIATLSLTSDPTIKTTCFAWTTPTRIILGHSDGSLSLWSIAPLTLLSRHPTHHSTIVDITTGYPSRPLLTVSIPLAGLPTLQDLASPSSETTSWALPSIAMQSTALQWHDDLQGFFVNHPSSSPLDSSASFMHARYFPHGPAVFSGSSAVTSFSAGVCHPFILVGLRDGSVYIANAIKKVFAARSEKPRKRKIMQHDFRPVELWPEALRDQTVRGAARILQMDVVELNERKDDKREEEEVGPNGPVAFRLVDPTRAINHEKGTRVGCIKWNPIREVASWAGIAMSSGLLFVMDMGVADATG